MSEVTEVPLTKEMVKKTLFITRIIGIVVSLGLAIGIFIAINNGSNSGVFTKAVIVFGISLAFFEFIRFVSAISLKNKLSSQTSNSATTSKGGTDLSPEAMDLVNKAFDYAVQNIKTTEDSFTSFVMFMKADASTNMARLVSDDPEVVTKMAQNEIEKLIENSESSEVVAYAIAQDARINLSDTKRDAVIVEVGCRATGNALIMAQQYEKAPKFREIDNIKIIQVASHRF